MSVHDRAETLRRAAAQMREAFADVAPGHEDAFYLAVADWLTHVAEIVDRMPKDVAPATPERVFRPAYTAARAYLGEQIVERPAPATATEWPDRAYPERECCDSRVMQYHEPTCPGGLA